MPQISFSYDWFGDGPWVNMLDAVNGANTTIDASLATRPYLVAGGGDPSNNFAIGLKDASYGVGAYFVTDTSLYMRTDSSVWVRMTMNSQSLG